MTEPHALLFSACNVSLECEDEFNHWYDNVHCPELLAVPGVRTAMRYRHAPVPAFPQALPVQRYLSIYELDNLAVVDSDAFNAVRGWDREGAIRPHVSGLDLRTYRSI